MKVNEVYDDILLGPSVVLACQSLEADSLLALRFNCSKIMLIGDPKQLPPCVLSDAGKINGLSQSLYARLYSIFNQYANGSITMLDTQYRMHPEICRFPSSQFYDGRLYTDVSMSLRTRPFRLRPLFLYNLTNSHHDQDNDLSSFNINEVSFIQKFCRMLTSYLVDQEDNESSSSEEEEENATDEDDEDRSCTSDDPSSAVPKDDGDEQRALRLIKDHNRRTVEVQKRIAIITPYHAQIRRLRSVLPPAIEIMTVDSAQGKEKDIVIISTVRSGDTIGFLQDENRMNVMLTRSKNALYIIGNFTQLAEQNSSWAALLDNAKSRSIIVDVDEQFPDLPYR